MRVSLALALVLGLAVLPACARVEATTRTERGPLLRTFHRPVILEGGVSATASVQWPRLELEVLSHDLCRDEEVAEFAEDRVTERGVPSAGPALSTGISFVLASAIAFGVSYAVSNAPDTSVIDRSGHYGPSTATQVRGWSYVGLGVGVPALVVGVIGYLQSGEDVKHLKVEQVQGQRDERCHPRRLAGSTELFGPRGTVATGESVDGRVSFEANAVSSEVQGVRFANREVELDAASEVMIDAFVACAALETEPPLPPLSELGEGALVARAGRLEACRALRPEAVAERLKAVRQELDRRRAQGSAGVLDAGAEPKSFEEAVLAHAPRLLLKAGSADLARLDDAAALEGQSALLEGVVGEGLSQNIGVVQVGPRALFVFLPNNRPWGADFGNGARIEAVVVMAGSQTVGERTLPLARAVWMRLSY